MGNIISYLKWRGDLTFAERPFCEVDNLVLSELAYLDLAGILPTKEQGGFLTPTQAAPLFYRQKRKNVCADGPEEEFFSLMAQSKRYGQVKLSHFIEVSDPSTQTDFSALQIELGDGTAYIAFRGTSDSLMGWREDFSMSFQLMPSQKLAAEYLDTVMDHPDWKYRVGGHSKGGNLAVYASMMLPKSKQEQILQVYSNDGPGLCPELVDMERYRGISQKLTRIVPEFCVIGALFENQPPTKIVRSNADGFRQHDGTSWQVEGDHFCTCKELSKNCELCNQIFDQWIESVDLEHRKTFIQDLFDALEAGGAKKRTDLAQGGFEEFESILLSVARSEGKTKLVIGKFIRSFFSAFASVQFARLFREKKTIQGILLFAVGLIFVIVPGFAAQCVGAGLGAAGVVYLGKKQLDFAFTQRGEEPNAKAKMLLNLVLICIIVFFIGQGSLLLYLSNYLIGGFFLFAAYRWVKNAFDRSLPMRSRVIKMIFGAVAFLLGMVPVITAGLVLWHYVFTAGTLLLIYGVGKIVHAMYENGRQTAKGGLQD